MPFSPPSISSWGRRSTAAEFESSRASALCGNESHHARKCAPACLVQGVSLRKKPAEFAPAGVNSDSDPFSPATCVSGKTPSQAASVRFVRLWRTNPARSRLHLSRKSGFATFSTVCAPPAQAGARLFTFWPRTAPSPVWAPPPPACAAAGPFPPRRWGWGHGQGQYRHPLGQVHGAHGEHPLKGRQEQHRQLHDHPRQERLVHGRVGQRPLGQQGLVLAADVEGVEGHGVGHAMVLAAAPHAGGPRWNSPSR